MNKSNSETILEEIQRGNIKSQIKKLDLGKFLIKEIQNQLQNNQENFQINFFQLIQKIHYIILNHIQNQKHIEQTFILLKYLELYIEEKLNDNQTREKILILNDLSCLCSRTNKINQALEYSKQAISLCQTKNDNKYLSLSYMNQAQIFSQIGDQSNSVFFYQKAIELSEAQLRQFNVKNIQNKHTYLYDLAKIFCLSLFNIGYQYVKILLKEIAEDYKICREYYVISYENLQNYLGNENKITKQIKEKISQFNQKLLNQKYLNLNIFQQFQYSSLKQNQLRNTQQNQKLTSSSILGVLEIDLNDKSNCMDINLNKSNYISSEKSFFSLKNSISTHTLQLNLKKNSDLIYEDINFKIGNYRGILNVIIYNKNKQLVMFQIQMVEFKVGIKYFSHMIDISELTLKYKQNIYKILNQKIIREIISHFQIEDGFLLLNTSSKKIKTQVQIQNLKVMLSKSNKQKSVLTLYNERSSIYLSQEDQKQIVYVNKSNIKSNKQIDNASDCVSFDGSECNTWQEKSPIRIKNEQNISQIKQKQNISFLSPQKIAANEYSKDYKQFYLQVYNKDLLKNISNIKKGSKKKKKNRSSRETAEFVDTVYNEYFTQFFNSKDINNKNRLHKKIYIKQQFEPKLETVQSRESRRIQESKSAEKLEKNNQIQITKKIDLMGDDIQTVSSHELKDKQMETFITQEIESLHTEKKQKNQKKLIKSKCFLKLKRSKSYQSFLKAESEKIVKDQSQKQFYFILQTQKNSNNRQQSVPIYQIIQDEIKDQEAIIYKSKYQCLDNLQNLYQKYLRREQISQKSSEFQIDSEIKEQIEMNFQLVTQSSINLKDQLDVMNGNLTEQNEVNGEQVQDLVKQLDYIKSQTIKNFNNSMYQIKKIENKLSQIQCPSQRSQQQSQRFEQILKEEILQQEQILQETFVLQEEEIIQKQDEIEQIQQISQDKMQFLSNNQELIKQINQIEEIYNGNQQVNYQQISNEQLTINQEIIQLNQIKYEKILLIQSELSESNQALEEIEKKFQKTKQEIISLIDRLTNISENDLKILLNYLLQVKQEINQILERSHEDILKIKENFQQQIKKEEKITECCIIPINIIQEDIHQQQNQENVQNIIEIDQIIQKIQEPESEPESEPKSEPKSEPQSEPEPELIEDYEEPNYEYILDNPEQRKLKNLLYKSQLKQYNNCYEDISEESYYYSSDESDSSHDEKQSMQIENNPESGKIEIKFQNHNYLLQDQQKYQINQIQDIIQQHYSLINDHFFKKEEISNPQLLEDNVIQEIIKEQYLQASQVATYCFMEFINDQLSIFKEIKQIIRHKKQSIAQDDFEENFFKNYANYNMQDELKWQINSLYSKANSAIQQQVQKEQKLRQSQAYKDNSPINANKW